MENKITLQGLLLITLFFAASSVFATSHGDTWMDGAKRERVSVDGEKREITKRKENPESQIGIVGVIFIIILYFLPTVTAEIRKHKSSAAITFVNLFLGWTAIGWLWAMIWSLTGNVHEKQGIKEPSGGWDKLSKPLNPRSIKDDQAVREFVETISKEEARGPRD